MSDERALVYWGRQAKQAIERYIQQDAEVALGLYPPWLRGGGRIRSIIRHLWRHWSLWRRGHDGAA